MRRLTVFNQISLDGYFTGEDGDLSWAHDPERMKDKEWQAFVEGNAKRGGELVFGRVTYEMMFRHWPTAQAKREDPIVAERMNAGSKVVFSRSLRKANWTNTRLVHDDPATEIPRLKAQPGPDLVVIGSGTIVRQLAEAGLVDEYQFVLLPVVLGAGRTLFEGLDDRIGMKATRTRSFGNGNVLVCYEPEMVAAGVGATEHPGRG